MAPGNLLMLVNRFERNFWYKSPSKLLLSNAGSCCKMQRGKLENTHILKSNDHTFAIGKIRRTSSQILTWPYRVMISCKLKLQSKFSTTLPNLINMFEVLSNPRIVSWVEQSASRSAIASPTGVTLTYASYHPPAHVQKSNFKSNLPIKKSSTNFVTTL